MALICPHLSGVYYITGTSSTSQVPAGTSFIEVTNDSTGVPSVHFVDCIEDQCQIWDAEHEQCGMLVSEHVGHTPDEARGTILKIMEHIHNRHLHQSAHDCSTDAYEEATPGSDCGADIDEKQPPPLALALVTEFVSNEDRDGDPSGWVYGKDFRIADNSEKPTMLKALEESPDFTATYNLTWSQYKTIMGV